jgi:hypothetical protein
MKFIDFNNNQRSIDLSKAKKRTNNNKSKGCQQLYDYVRNLWPQFDIFEEFPCLGTKLKLDLFIPLMRIAFEFDGKQHDEFNSFFHKDRYVFAKSKINDIEKEQWCDINKVKLIRIKDSDLVDLHNVIRKAMLS